MKKYLFALAVMTMTAATMAPLQAGAQQIGVRITAGYAPPPAPRYEVVPAPRRGYEWVPGYWNWENRHHVWRKGHWERARPGYFYNQPRWQEGDNGWYLERGGWRQGHRDNDRWHNPPRAGHPHGDRDRDGIPNRADRDRDGDGRNNRHDRSPGNPHRQ